ncbi:DsbA family protein [Shewanella donghaensis]|uniref:DsbA family protein n=1 Tax=Shewanella donghaensis TaxID=238836 RepID=UPI0011837C87|nr:DsbA family protein [Shewanella donghaensis]
MQQVSHTQIQLSYVYDPMCSWCWGYRPTWLALEQQIKEQLPQVNICYRLGGLAPDSDVPMPQEMQQFLVQTWHKIANQLGTQFNFDFWTQCQPRRSTYPACRACLVAREYGLESQMYAAIQQAYYLDAQNPSDDSTLIALANKLGIDVARFSEQLTSLATKQQFKEELQLTHSLPIQGFPSLVLSIEQNHFSIPIDYVNFQTSLDAIKKALCTR